jgi:hypothetical protein
VTRLDLVHDLQAKGIQYREARFLANAVLRAMKAGLHRDGNVELPFGRLVLKRNKPPWNMWRKNKLVPMNRAKWKIKFENIE